MKFVVLVLLFLSSILAHAMLKAPAQNLGGSCPASTASLSPLFHGICNGNESEFSAALESFKSSGAQPETAVDRFGLSPLHWAASLWNLSMVERLIGAGFSPNQSGGSKKNTSLHSAVKGNHFGGELDPENQMAVIRLLVEIGKGDPRTPNLDGDTPKKLAENLRLANVVAYFEEQQKILSAAANSAPLAESSKPRS